jgi:hypothetical protein
VVLDLLPSSSCATTEGKNGNRAREDGGFSPKLQCNPCNLVLTHANITRMAAPKITLSRRYVTGSLQPRNKSFWYFWYYWSTIQNTANRHVSNAFDLIAVFISFSLALCAGGANS